MTVNSKEKNSEDFGLDFIPEFGLSTHTYTSVFQILWVLYRPFSGAKWISVRKVWNKDLDYKRIEEPYKQHQPRGRRNTVFRMRLAQCIPPYKNVLFFIKFVNFYSY